MANDQDGPEDKQSVLGSDFLIPIAAIALTLYYFTTIIDSPWTAQVTAFFVGITLIVLSVIFFVRSMIRLKTGAARFTLRDIAEPTSILPQRAILLALTVGSVVFISWLGFTLTSILFLSGSILLLTKGRNPVRILTLSGVLSVVWFVLFVLIFKRRFPLSWLDEQIKAVVLPLLKSVGLG